MRNCTYTFHLLFKQSFAEAIWTLSLLQTVVDEDPGLEGNLLVERMVGAHVSLVSKEEYVKLGSVVRFFSIFLNM